MIKLTEYGKDALITGRLKVYLDGDNRLWIQDINIELENVGKKFFKVRLKYNDNVVGETVAAMKVRKGDTIEIAKGAFAIEYRWGDGDLGSLM